MEVLISKTGSKKILHVGHVYVKNRTNKTTIIITCTLYLCYDTIKHLIGTSLEICSSITQRAIDALTSITLSASFFNLYNDTAILWNILTDKCPDWELSDPAKQVTEKCPALKINELRIVRPCKNWEILGLRNVPLPYQGYICVAYVLVQFLWLPSQTGWFYTVTLWYFP